jgi:hypothetical protein
MSGMNHNRPLFARQRVWERFDSMESPKARRDREARERTSLSKSRPDGQRYAKLDPLLLSFGGTDERMLAIQAKRQRGEDLSNSDQAWSYEVLRHVATKRRARTQQTKTRQASLPAAAMQPVQTAQEQST